MAVPDEGRRVEKVPDVRRYGFGGSRVTNTRGVKISFAGSGAGGVPLNKLAGGRAVRAGQPVFFLPTDDEWCLPDHHNLDAQPPSPRETHPDHHTNNPPNNPPSTSIHDTVSELPEPPSTSRPLNTSATLSFLLVRRPDQTRPYHTIPLNQLENPILTVRLEFSFLILLPLYPAKPAKPP